jgi:hypothetical protein
MEMFCRQSEAWVGTLVAEGVIINGDVGILCRRERFVFRAQTRTDSDCLLLLLNTVIITTVTLHNLYCR